MQYWIEEDEDALFADSDADTDPTTSFFLQKLEQLTELLNSFIFTTELEEVPPDVLRKLTELIFVSMNSWNDIVLPWNEQIYVAKHLYTLTIRLMKALREPMTEEALATYPRRCWMKTEIEKQKARKALYNQAWESCQFLIRWSRNRHDLSLFSFSSEEYA